MLYTPIMADKKTQQVVLECVQRAKEPLSISDIMKYCGVPVAERTLRRWLSDWVEAGILVRSGSRRSTRYISHTATPTYPKFLATVSGERKPIILKQLRDLWTHTSTALEGNTLSLGDTHFLLEEGLTVSGKPLKDHLEVVGHAKAIDLIYESLEASLSVDVIFQLHKAIQTEHVIDIYKPNGAWKREVNGTYVVTQDNKQVFVEYAHPTDVPCLMEEIIAEINHLSHQTISLDAAPEWYSKIYAGIAHVHPFWDGNGRIARLLANIPLLNSGLPPLVIPLEMRRTYIQLLAEYEIKTGGITRNTGVWPALHHLKAFEEFCASAFESTKHIIGKN